MMRSLLVYGLLVGALLGVAALAADGLLRLAGRPTRWVWSAAIALTVLLTTLAPGRAPDGADLALTGVPVSAMAPAARHTATIPERTLIAVRAARARAVAAVERGLATVERALPASIDRWLVVAWSAASALLLVAFAAAYRRFHRTRVHWPVARVQGWRVRLAPDAGPMVAGLARPEIVVPRWLLGLPPDEQRLVLAHEQEHVRARDSLLLAAGCTVAALLPWHPAVWWMLRRLSLSVEIDCDRRLLRTGVAPQSYGTLLIDLAGRGAGLGLGMPALSDRTSDLERRLLAMTTNRSRFPLARGAALAAAGLLATLAACEARIPTAAEVDAMDASAATRELALTKRAADSTIFYVDGAVVSAAQAKRIDAAHIASVEVNKNRERGAAEVHITTMARASADTAYATRIFPRQRVAYGAAGTAGTDTVYAGVMLPTLADEHSVIRLRSKVKALVYIDGVRSDETAMRALSPDRIDRVEVLKGAAAAKAYSDPEAANGVIVITTKK